MPMRSRWGGVARFSIFAITLSDVEAQGLTLAEPPIWRRFLLSGTVAVGAPNRAICRPRDWLSA
jgi:hypothetical protein